jgi:hypothetical protein
MFLNDNLHQVEILRLNPNKYFMFLLLFKKDILKIKIYT